MHGNKVRTRPGCIKDATCNKLVKLHMMKNFQSFKPQIRDEIMHTYFGSPPVNAPWYTWSSLTRPIGLLDPLDLRSNF